MVGGREVGRMEEGRKEGRKEGSRDGLHGRFGL